MQVSASLRRYAVVVLMIAAAETAFLCFNYPLGRWAPILALAIMNVVVENFAFALPIGGSVSLAFAANFAALLFGGPLASVICVVAGSTNLNELREGRPLTLRLFNVGQLAVSAGTAGIAYVRLGGVPLSAGDTPEMNLLAAAIAAAVFFIMNVVLVGYGASLLTRKSMSEVVRGQGYGSYAASLVVLALLGLVIAHLLWLDSWIGILLLALPFMAARRTFRVYAELSEAYTSTVRSLVAAIEAKDPYTKGHSERVAVYARGLAETLGLSHNQVELVERAALLHDVGKIGIPVDTLTSPVQLTSEEVRLIHQHPDVGSSLLSDVEFLSDIVPIVRHHHERYDGAGYPQGLLGEEIPHLARLLSVADAYDAMTSTRAYRLGMRQQEAVVELKRVSGQQLDPRMVEHFMVLLAEEPLEAVAHGTD